MIKISTTNYIEFIADGKRYRIFGEAVTRGPSSGFYLFPDQLEIYCESGYFPVLDFTEKSVAIDKLFEYAAAKSMPLKIQR